MKSTKGILFCLHLHPLPQFSVIFDQIYRSVRFRDHLRSVKQSIFEKILRSTTFIYNKPAMHLVFSCYIILAVAADQLLMSTTTPGTPPFCTRVLALSYLKFEFMILHELIVNLFEKRVGDHGEKKQIFVLNLICKHTTTMKTMVWLSKITRTAGHVFIDLKITFLFSTSGALKGSFSFEKVISCS